VITQPRLNQSGDFVAGKLARVHDAQVWPLHKLEQRRAEGRQVFYGDNACTDQFLLS
jgi:hypothetical protein